MRVSRLGKSAVSAFSALSIITFSIFFSGAGPDCIPNHLMCPTDDGTDFLPGHGPRSSNADAGHQFLNSTGAQALQHNAQNFGSFAWGGVAIYIELNQ